ncbi:hypothetical protein CIW52_01910 [Mycolicibacterium sp. P9-64]|nr:hypothetical protein CIW52_01910 [Mycolicibacterium sp. P9-64]
MDRSRVHRREHPRAALVAPSPQLATTDDEVTEAVFQVERLSGAEIAAHWIQKESDVRKRLYGS